MKVSEYTKGLHAGGHEERRMILRKLRRDMKGDWAPDVRDYVGVFLIPWILKRHERFAKAKGGM